MQIASENIEILNVITKLTNSSLGSPLRLLSNTVEHRLSSPDLRYHKLGHRKFHHSKYNRPQNKRQLRLPHLSKLSLQILFPHHQDPQQKAISPRNIFKCLSRKTNRPIRDPTRRNRKSRYRIRFQGRHVCCERGSVIVFKEIGSWVLECM